MADAQTGGGVQATEPAADGADQTDLFLGPSGSRYHPAITKQALSDCSKAMLTGSGEEMRLCFCVSQMGSRRQKTKGESLCPQPWAPPATSFPSYPPDRLLGLICWARIAFSFLISSWYSRRRASFGSSLMRGLFLMFLARLA